MVSWNSIKPFLGKRVNVHLTDGAVLVNVLLEEPPSNILVGRAKVVAVIVCGNYRIIPAHLIVSLDVIPAWEVTPC